MDLLRQFQSKHDKNKAITAFQAESEADIKTSKIISSDIPEASPQPIIAAPTEQDRELDTLIEKLRAANQHWKIEWARAKRVPMKALIHAAELWLSDDPADWTAANDTICQYTSQFGNKQLCYRRLGRGKQQ